LIRKGFYNSGNCKKCPFFTIATAKTDESIQNISGVAQGLAAAWVIEWEDADRPSGETHAARSAQS
jgi:hypothetical protein